MKKTVLFTVTCGLSLAVFCICSGCGAYLLQLPLNGTGYGFSYLFCASAAVFYLMLYKLSAPPPEDAQINLLRRVDCLLLGAASAAVGVLGLLDRTRGYAEPTPVQTAAHWFFVAAGLLAAVLLLSAALSRSAKIAGASVSAFVLWCVAAIINTTGSVFNQPDVTLYLPRILAMFCAGTAVWELYAFSRTGTARQYRFLRATAAMGACACAADVIFWLVYRTNPYREQGMPALLFSLLMGAWMAWLVFGLKKRAANKRRTEVV